MTQLFSFFLTEQEGFPPTGILFDIRKRSMDTGKERQHGNKKIKKQIAAMIA
jgi:hypothetical protein